MAIRQNNLLPSLLIPLFFILIHGVGLFFFDFSILWFLVFDTLILIILLVFAERWKIKVVCLILVNTALLCLINGLISRDLSYALKLFYRLSLATVFIFDFLNFPVIRRLMGRIALIRDAKYALSLVRYDFDEMKKLDLPLKDKLLFLVERQHERAREK